MRGGRRGLHPVMSWRRRVAVAALTPLAMAGCTATNSGTPDQLARGEELYEANCASCHGRATGGDIADIPPPHNAEGHTWHHPDCELVEFVEDGMPHRSGLPDDAPQMPAFGDRLAQDDIRSILAYIKTWWDEDQRQFQQHVTRQKCQ